MKLTQRQFLVILSLLGVTSAYSQTTYVAGDVPVTIALTEKTSTAGTFVHDPSTGKPDTNQPAYSDTWSTVDANLNPVADYNVAIAKPSTAKYDTKAFIAYLVTNGVISDVTAAGWSLWATPVYDNTDPSGQLSYTVYAKKKGFDNVDLSAYFVSTPGLETVDFTSAPSGVTLNPAISYSVSDTTTYYSTSTSDNPPISGPGSGLAKPLIHSGSYTFEGPVSGGLIYTTDQSGYISFTGVFTGSAKDTTYLDPTDKTTVTVVAIPGASKITFNAGSDTAYLDTPVSVSGTISFGASKAVKSTLQ